MTFSKKLAVVAVAALIMMADARGYLQLDESHVNGLALIMIAYLGGQSVVDALVYKERERKDG